MNYYYTVYKITNKINDRYYIGAHQTKDLNDGYMGSGTYLKHAIKKHGIENFEKEIVCLCETVEQIYEMEAKLVKIDDPKSYNLRNGGREGWKQSEEAKRKISIARKDKKLSVEHRKKISVAMTGENNPRYGKPGTMLDKKHTEETKQKMRGIRGPKKQTK